MKNLVGIGIFLIILGFVVVTIGSLTDGRQKSTGTKVAIGGFIGPIPFGWANDKRLFYPLMGLMIALAVFWIVWQLTR